MNGSNEWGVKFGSISFMEKMLFSHKNVAAFTRTDDVLFVIQQKMPAATKTALLVDIYVFGESDFHRASATFGGLTSIVQAGKWAKFTHEARQLADLSGVSLMDMGSLYAALFKE